MAEDSNHYTPLSQQQQPKSDQINQPDPFIIPEEEEPKPKVRQNLVAPEKMKPRPDFDLNQVAPALEESGFDFNLNQVAPAQEKPRPDSDLNQVAHEEGDSETESNVNSVIDAHPINAHEKMPKRRKSERIGSGRPSWLPWDWRMESMVRKGGLSAGKIDRLYYEPKRGTQLRSKAEVMAFQKMGKKPNKMNPKSKDPPTMIAGNLFFGGGGNPADQGTSSNKNTNQLHQGRRWQGVGDPPSVLEHASKCMLASEYRLPGSYDDRVHVRQDITSQPITRVDPEEQWRIFETGMLGGRTREEFERDYPGMLEAMRVQWRASH